jgi:hypothetical protein
MPLTPAQLTECVEKMLQLRNLTGIRNVNVMDDNLLENTVLAIFDHPTNIVPGLVNINDNDYITIQTRLLDLLRNSPNADTIYTDVINTHNDHFQDGNGNFPPPPLLQRGVAQGGKKRRTKRRKNKRRSRRM